MLYWLFTLARASISSLQSVLIDEKVTKITHHVCVGDVTEGDPLMRQKFPPVRCLSRFYMESYP